VIEARKPLTTPYPLTSGRIGVTDLRALALTNIEERTGKVTPSGAPSARPSDTPVATMRWTAPPPERRPGWRIRVLAAHPGAGASTTALAIADLASHLDDTLLIDSADPVWSGLHIVDQHNPVAHEGWRLSNRGSLRLLRLATHAEDPFAVPVLLRPAAAVTVHDIGWSLRELTQSAGGWSADPIATDVLVTRSTLTGIQHMERALRGLEPDHRDRVQLAVIGTRRQSPLLRSAGGPCTRARCEADAMTLFPALSHPPGELTPIDRLPRVLLSAAGQLLDRITRARTPSGELADLSQAVLDRRPWRPAPRGPMACTPTRP
jgi:hypothetical protein